MLQLTALLFVVSSTVAEVDVSDLARNASWIGRVKVSSVQSDISAEFPMSDISATIVEVIKGEGAKDQVVHFAMPGGDRGQKKYMVLGLPPLRIGNDYMVFLTKDPTLTVAASINDLAALTGWTVFKVFENQQGTHVMRSGDATLVQPTARGFALTHDRSVKDYDTFVSDVFRALD